MHYDLRCDLSSLSSAELARAKTRLVTASEEIVGEILPRSIMSSARAGIFRLLRCQGHTRALEAQLLVAYL